MTRPAVVWLRDDLRLSDNPALSAAAMSGRPLICVFIHDEASEGLRRLGGAARWWLHGSLAELHRSLAKHGGALTILHGPARATIEMIVTETNAGAIYWNRRYDDAGQSIDADVKAALDQRNIEALASNGHLLREPWEVLSKSGTPFRVFTAYWRAACKQSEPQAPMAAPRNLRFCPLPIGLAARSLELAALDLLPRTPDWAGGLRSTWQPGESAARARLEAFLTTKLRLYASCRDRPDKVATSRLSPYLRFGNISARQIWHATRAALIAASSRVSEHDAEKFLAEFGWREFCYHLLHYLPDIARRNIRAQFDAMSWRTDHATLRAWQRGKTGYPIVDAGMRELWTTGFMHNRVRMICASFLVKDLLIDWREGEAWFWDTLVDADAANNAANWQWVAGSGADPAPFFRIFNPVLQGEKFDPDGDYVRRWVPELARLPASLIHRPWAATARQCAAAGLRLGDTYPHPMVDHDAARRRALSAYHALRVF